MLVTSLKSKKLKAPEVGEYWTALLGTKMENKQIVKILYVPHHYNDASIIDIWDYFAFGVIDKDGYEFLILGAALIEKWNIK